LSSARAAILSPFKKGLARHNPGAAVKAAMIVNLGRPGTPRPNLPDFPTIQLFGKHMFVER
jgi:hypothetical protein